MDISQNKYIYIRYAIAIIWLCNCILGWIIAIKQSWLPYMNAWNTTYTSLHSDPFDGTILPILYIPDWNKTQYQNKTIQFADIPINDYVPIPQYDTNTLNAITDNSKNSVIVHYTYITPYMGSYRLNYKEYDGSHNAIDIRAPIGTPVLSIANGVVVRAVESDATGNKFVVIRHDNVPINWKIQNIYSGYLHLSEINVSEGIKIKKWTMIGRVGMSGIATTPHLHIQIDTENAPFHPYWPFTSTDSRLAGLSFFNSIDAGLWKENAKLYSIHPMNFIQSYLAWYNSNKLNTIVQNTKSNKEEIHELIPVNASVESIIASMNSAPSSGITKTSTSKPLSNVTSSSNKISCEKKRFSDISNTNKVSKILYQLVDQKCMFQNISSFNPNATITQKDAIIMLMQYYGIAPTSGTSHFLDIAIGDNFQRYAIAWYRRGILDGNYALPGKLLSKEDFIELLVKIGKFERNPSQLKIYKDTSPMNVKFQYIQDYGFKTRARWGNFYPQSLLTRQWAVELLGNVMTREQAKK